LGLLAADCGPVGVPIWILPPLAVPIQCPPLPEFCEHQPFVELTCSLWAANLGFVYRYWELTSGNVADLHRLPLFRATPLPPQVPPSRWTPSRWAAERDTDVVDSMLRLLASVIEVAKAQRGIH
jgi:hypothetical protein